MMIRNCPPMDMYYVPPSRYAASKYVAKDMDWVLEQIRSGQTLTVDCQQRNGLILCKPFHAEFAGPGATVGGIFDLDCQKVLAVGNGSVQLAKSYTENQKAYRIRRSWIRLMREFTQIDSPPQRAKKVLTQFEAYFGKDITGQIPDQALALLVGVLPQTIQSKRVS